MVGIPNNEEFVNGNFYDKLREVCASMPECDRTSMIRDCAIALIQMSGAAVGAQTKQVDVAVDKLWSVVALVATASLGPSSIKGASQEAIKSYAASTAMLNFVVSAACFPRDIDDGRWMTMIECSVRSLVNGFYCHTTDGLDGHEQERDDIQASIMTALGPILKRRKQQA